MSKITINKVHNPFNELEVLFGYINEYANFQEGIPLPRNIDPRKANCWFYESDTNLYDANNSIIEAMKNMGYESTGRGDFNSGFFHKVFHWNGILVALRVYVCNDYNEGAFHVALYPCMTNDGFIYPLSLEIEDHTLVDEEGYSFAFCVEFDEAGIFQFAFALDETNKRNVVAGLIKTFMEV